MTEVSNVRELTRVMEYLTVYRNTVRGYLESSELTSAELTDIAKAVGHLDCAMESLNSRLDEEYAKTSKDRLQRIRSIASNAMDTGMSDDDKHNALARVLKLTEDFPA